MEGKTVLLAFACIKKLLRIKQNETGRKKICLTKNKTHKQQNPNWPTRGEPGNLSCSLVTIVLKSLEKVSFSIWSEGWQKERGFFHHIWQAQQMK